MQEEVEHRAIAITVSAGKMTARTLAQIFMAVLRRMKREQRTAQTPQGRQSVKKLMNHGVATNSIPLDGDTRLFDRIARKFNVDYAFHKTGPKKYLLLFKAGQADAITQCFAEYSKLVMKKQRKAPVREQMEQAAELVKNKPHERVRKREVSRGDR